MKTLTTEQVFQHMSDNLRDGKSPVDGLQIISDGIGWSNGWTDLPEMATVGLIVSDKCKFRLTPRTRNICGFDVPAPEVEEPEDGVFCYQLIPWEEDGVRGYKWRGSISDRNALRNGIWLNEEDAIANRKALRGENPYE